MSRQTDLMDLIVKAIAERFSVNPAHVTREDVMYADWRAHHCSIRVTVYANGEVRAKVVSGARESSLRSFIVLKDNETLVREVIDYVDHRIAKFHDRGSGVTGGDGPP